MFLYFFYLKARHLRDAKDHELLREALEAADATIEVCSSGEGESWEWFSALGFVGLADPINDEPFKYFHDSMKGVVPHAEVSIGLIDTDCPTYDVEVIDKNFISFFGGEGPKRRIIIDPTMGVAGPSVAEAEKAGEIEDDN